MRVIGGKWKGRRLAPPKGTGLRPTTDRVKESLFEILAVRLTGATVLDLCCGAGSFGIEALSRRAGFVHLVDIAPAAVRLARKNLQTCGADPESYVVHRAEAVRWLDSFLRLKSEGPVIVLADPPYQSDLPQRILDLLMGVPEALPLEAAIIEHAAGFFPQLGPNARLRNRRRQYGETALTILEA